MDFEDRPEDAAWRARARAWLAANAPAPACDATDQAGLLQASLAWHRRKFDAGYACIRWPAESGGPGGTLIQQVIFDQEEARYRVPVDFLVLGLDMCLPTVAAHADAPACRRLLPPGLRGDEIWCQLFSEPAGGSDLAAARTRAVREGGDWLVNGQKVWTSLANVAHWGLLLARTDPARPKHQGLTMFFLRMDSPGITVRPIRQANGGADFNEVFLTDVRIPDAQRIGPVNGGWKVSLTTLMHERVSVGGGSTGADWRELMALARSIETATGPALADPAVREKLADWYVQTAGVQYTTWRTLTALARGQAPGPEGSIGKLVGCAKAQDLAAFAMELQGEAGALYRADAPMASLFQDSWLLNAGKRIAGGTDEIMRNIIAERVLGLPPDIRVDKELPFDSL